MQKDTEIGIMSFFGDRACPLKVHQFPGHFHVKNKVIDPKYYEI